MRTRLFLPASLAFVALSLARAQTPATPTEAQPEPSPAAAQPAQPQTAPAPASAAPEVVIHDEVPGSVTRSKDTLSVDFPDEEIRNILRNVADLFELNLVIPETLQGKTSIKLRDVTWRQIFQVVLSPVGYTFIEEGNIIKVVSQETLLQEPVTTEVFILNYAKTTDIKPTVEGLVETAAGGKLLIDVRSNALVITERPSRLTRIRAIVEQLDKATEQVVIESKFIEVTGSDVKNIGVNWASLSGYKVGVGEISNTWERSREQSFEQGGGTSSDSTSTSSSGTSSSSGSNASSSVTSTGGTVTSTSTTGNTASLGSTGSNGTDVSSVVSSINNLVNSGATSRVATAVFSADDFGVVLSALQTLSSTRIVSNPTVVTLNNTPSEINVGEEYPIPNYTYNQERGTFEVSGFTYRPIGILLKVTPQVNAQGFIKLTIEPEVSQRNGQTNFGGAGGAEIPIIATRKAKTQVSLKDGYTMGIGGLIRKQDINGSTKVPILGDIPLLGRAFKSKTKNEDTTNLLIFITAKTVNAEGASLGEVFDPRVTRGLGLREQDLPGYRDGSSPYAPAEAPATTKTEAK
ncbi:MAG TPA: secretin N-terminal domain-containing protein [Opitutaceae bacterium]